MAQINLRKVIDEIDRKNFCKDDLLNMYEACQFNDKEKIKLVEMASRNQENRIKKYIIEKYDKKFNGVKMYCNPSPDAFNAFMGEDLDDDFIESYGGAYDIDEDEYFTIEDLDEFLDYIIEEIERNFNVRNSIEIYDADIDDNIISVTLSFNGYEEQYKTRIDMRKIKVPSDIIKRYADEFIEYFTNRFQEAIDNEDIIIDESYEDKSSNKLLTEEVYSATIFDDNNRELNLKNLPNPIYFGGSPNIALEDNSIFKFVDYIRGRRNSSKDPVNNSLFKELSKIEKEPYTVKIDIVPEEYYTEINNNSMVIYGTRRDRNIANALVLGSKENRRTGYENYIIHHLNKKEFDNRPENLIAVPDDAIHKILEILPETERENNKRTFGRDNIKVLIPNDNGKFEEANCKITVEITKI